MKCTIIDFETAAWQRLDQFEDRTVFQTRDWLRFIAETQKATPLLVELNQDGQLAGYFSGLTFTKFGIKILGSSFPGWTTPYVGFNMLPGASRAEALAAVEKLAWESQKCMHMEVSDPNFLADDGAKLGFASGAYISYRTDLRQSEDDLFNAMDSACRRCIRKAEKSGVTIEEAHDPAFADEYYAQLEEVFAKQGLVPTYPVERVRVLIKHMDSTGRVLLLRARDPEGKCIATGIFPGFNKIAEFWGNASLRSGQIWRPNEYMQWYVMRYWKKRGIEVYDWGGEGSYKEKYGCVPHRVPWFSKSRHQVVGKLRDEAKKMYARKQRLMGWLKTRKAQPVE
jgi:CelD/BcsL family acetyltransferase involved in cellulose biosynthesis